MDGASSHCTKGGDQNHPQEKEMQKGKIVVWRGLQIAEKKTKEKIYQPECRVPKNSKER